jgi:hypothetical protein
MTPTGPTQRYEIIKTYPTRGPLQQYRLAANTAFACFRCGRTKKSKLITVLRQNWSHLLCNACYGRLLSIVEIRGGEGDDSAKSDALAERLLTLASEEEQRSAEAILAVRMDYARSLTPRTLKLLATSDFVANQLKSATDLDWSASVIGVCKAFELEVTVRVMDPLAHECEGRPLDTDVRDSDLGRVARYCAGRIEKPPELGVVQHFLDTAANSVTRQASSELLGALRSVTRRWPHSDWLLQRSGAQSGIATLLTFRNRAAHTDELANEDYTTCSKLVLGPQGLLWHLLQATIR